MMHFLTDPLNHTTADMMRSRVVKGHEVPAALGAGTGELCDRYRDVLAEPRVSWTESHRILRKLGSGGQGVVFLCERGGSDGFTLPVALKIFSPDGYPDADQYNAAMARMAQVAMRIAQIQQDNLIDVHNVVSLRGVRLMEMEWIDGYDLHRLLTREMLDRVKGRVDADRREYLEDVIITDGPSQPKLKPGVAISILRGCLSALSALHREGIVHGDVKPGNIMLKCTGNPKLIDTGSAYEWGHGARPRMCTPAYAAPEILEGGEGSPRSDLASLGYVLLEMLAGAPPFAGVNDADGLIAAKGAVIDRLPETLPDDVVRNELLMNLIAGLIAPDPADRFPDAEAADFLEEGAASFHRQLVRGNLSSEYENEIRLWLQELE